jgi:hypothetical protein
VCVRQKLHIDQQCFGELNAKDQIHSALTPATSNSTNISAHTMPMGGQAEGLACADPGVRTPIGLIGNYMNKHRREGTLLVFQALLDLSPCQLVI